MALRIRRTTETATDLEMELALTVTAHRLRTKLALNYVYANVLRIRSTLAAQTLNNNIDINTGSETRTCIHKYSKNLFCQFSHSFFCV